MVEKKSNELQNHVDWIKHTDLQDYLSKPNIPHPWFPAYQYNTNNNYSIARFCALIPLSIIPTCLQNNSWDLFMTDGCPSVWTHYRKGKIRKKVYCPFGNEDGIEPIIICRDFHGIRGDFTELAQEFRLYHNLYHEPSRKRFLLFNRDGDESEAARYNTDLFEVRTDLLMKYCAVKRMALGIFVDSYRHSPFTLKELGLKETRKPMSGTSYIYHLVIVPSDFSFDLDKKFKTMGGLLGKKYILPDQSLLEEDNKRLTVYQEFIIGTDAQGKPIKHTCDPDKLSNYFGKNPNAPNYLTPVFFRAEVFAKYYAEPKKYSVEDGYLRCKGLWGLRMDNDHPDYVVVWLGDLGRDLSESERSYWLSYNIPPHGRRISETNFRRAFMAVPTNPKKPDLVFKQEYAQFRKQFHKAHGWDFFLALHKDDEHFLTGLHSLINDNQSEFDSQLLALTKVIVDSINEKAISKGLVSLSKDDKGITKLEKFFTERNMVQFESYIRFLRVLQDLRSKSAAHRKGSNYEKLIEDMEIADEGQQKVFNTLLIAAVSFLRYLSKNLIVKNP